MLSLEIKNVALEWNYTNWSSHVYPWNNSLSIEVLMELCSTDWSYNVSRYPWNNILPIEILTEWIVDIQMTWD